MKQYEVTFIVDPVLSGDEVKATAKNVDDLLLKEGCSIVHFEEMGIRQLAYPINRRSSGHYYCIEFTTPTGVFLSKFELTLTRDERILRYLTISLDKYGIKYNEDKRGGRIGTRKKKETAPAKEARPEPAPIPAVADAAPPKVAKPKPAPLPVVEAVAPAITAIPEPAPVLAVEEAVPAITAIPEPAPVLAAEDAVPAMEAIPEPEPLPVAAVPDLMEDVAQMVDEEIAPVIPEEIAAEVQPDPVLNS